MGKNADLVLVVHSLQTTLVNPTIAEIAKVLDIEPQHAALLANEAEERFAPTLPFGEVDG